MKQLYHLLLLLPVFLLCACEKDDPVVTAISLDRQELEIFVGETYQFELSHVDPDAPAPANGKLKAEAITARLPWQPSATVAC